MAIWARPNHVHLNWSPRTANNVSEWLIPWIAKCRNTVQIGTFPTGNMWWLDHESDETFTLRRVAIDIESE
jgi:hypothetical protein